ISQRVFCLVDLAFQLADLVEHVSPCRPGLAGQGRAERTPVRPQPARRVGQRRARRVEVLQRRPVHVLPARQLVFSHRPPIRSVLGLLTGVTAGRPRYRHATRTNTPTTATSGIEIVTGSPPVIPGAAAAPAGSVAAFTAYRRVVLRHGAAVTRALTKDAPRGRGDPPTRGRIAALSAAASVRLIRRSSRLTARRTIASTATTTATAGPAAAVRARGQGHRASLPPTAAAEPPNLMRKALRS